MKTGEGTLSELGSHHHVSQLASIGQIAAGIAHEVRNPLTAVKGFLQLLQQDQKVEYIDIAHSELDNALKTLNNLLQVSKPDLEDEEFQSIYLSVEMESIINLFQDKMYQIDVITDFRDTDSAIYGRKNQFKKAFFNLIKNAIEAMNGTGTLTLTHRVIGHEVIVTIKDTGVGIPEEKLSLLGTPFFTTKDDGTGMGLAQVFSVIYQHGGNIIVESKESQGTVFTIKIPQHHNKTQRGVRKLDILYEETYSIKDFFLENQKLFEDRLLTEATNVRDKIEEIHNIGNINLLSNAHKLVLYVVEGREHELISFAKQEGRAWASHSLTLAFKLEWIQAIRRTLWDFLYNFDTLTNVESDRADFFTMEKSINELIDQFFTYFFISYNKYKDEQLDKQRQLVENLSVPIIPINTDICILPLIGAIDEIRVTTIQDKVFAEVENRQIQTLIIDLSGVASMGQSAADSFIKTIDGLSMMGCSTILTGMRSEIVKHMISLGIPLYKKAAFKGTLQLALNDVIFQTESLES
jgi:anti-anti-sigma regulatory factor